MNFYINISTSTVFFLHPPEISGTHHPPPPFYRRWKPRLQQQLAGLAAEPLNEAVELEVPEMDGRHACHVELLVFLHVKRHKTPKDSFSDQEGHATCTIQPTARWF